MELVLVRIDRTGETADRLADGPLRRIGGTMVR
jgi:hypothetical protein